MHMNFLTNNKNKIYVTVYMANALIVRHAKCTISKIEDADVLKNLTFSFVQVKFLYHHQYHNTIYFSITLTQQDNIPHNSDSCLSVPISAPYQLLEPCGQTLHILPLGMLS